MRKPNLFIEITTTNDCNCHCSYCFENCHQVKQNIVDGYEENVIRLLVKQCLEFDSQKYGWFVISFWGGEPFLNVKFVEEVIKNTVGYNFVHYHFYSNGTLPEIIEDFVSCDFVQAVKTRIHIQLSYDGQPVHALKRGDNEKLVMKSANIIASYGISFSFKATLTFDSVKHLPSIWQSYYKLYHEYGDFVRYYPTLDTTCATDAYIDDWKEALSSICRFEYKFILEHGHALFGWLNEGYKRNCNINNSFHIHTDGNIYLCHGCMYQPDKDKYVISGLSKIDSLTEVETPVVDVNFLPDKCKLCPATQCAVCHVETLHDSTNPIKDWISCKVNNETRCKYFKWFGYFAKMLQYCLDDKGYMVKS